jgi:hypothetical protein
MAFSVFMTFSKTINNSELMANLADLLEGPSIVSRAKVRGAASRWPLSARSRRTWEGAEVTYN